MKAIKGNKVYDVDKTTKGAYLAQGYDITDDKGKIIERSPSGAVKRSDYDKALAEIEKLKEEIAQLKGEGGKDVPES